MPYCVTMLLAIAGCTLDVIACAGRRVIKFISSAARPRLKISDVVRIDGRFLVVDGEKA